MITSPAPLIVVISAIVVLAVTRNLVAASPYVIAAQAMAVVLSVWARRSFPKGTFRVAAVPGGSSVIRRGPYRFVRHPMYSAALLFIWTAVLNHLSFWTLAIGAVVTSVVLRRVVVEERLLRTRTQSTASMLVPPAILPAAVCQCGLRKSVLTGSKPSSRLEE